MPDTVNQFNTDTDDQVTNATDQESITPTIVGELLKRAVAFFAVLKVLFDGGNTPSATLVIGTTNAQDVDFRTDGTRRGGFKKTTGAFEAVGGSMPTETPAVNILRGTGSGNGVILSGGTSVNTFEFRYDGTATRYKGFFAPIRFETDANDHIYITPGGTGKVGVGFATAPSAKLHVIATTEQWRAGYDASNYYNATVGSTGIVTFDAAGSAASFVFNKKVTIGVSLFMDTIVTAGGTTGNQTINKPSGTVNIAAAGTTVTVTNSLVTANSIVHAVLRTNDGTAWIKNVVPGVGSFVINLGTAATGEVSIGFIVIN